MSATGSSPPRTSAGTLPGQKVRRSEVRARRLLAAWLEVFPIGRHSAAEVTGVLRRRGEKYAELREAIEDCLGKAIKGKDSPVKQLSAYLRQRVIENEGHRLVSSRDRPMRFWVELREPEPRYLVEEPPLQTLVRTGSFAPDEPAVLIDMTDPATASAIPSSDAPRPVFPGTAADMQPRSVLPLTAPMLGSAQPSVVPQPSQPGEPSPLVYPNGRIRGQRHRDVIARAAGDSMPGYRYDPVRGQFNGVDEAAARKGLARDPGPVDLLRRGSADESDQTTPGPSAWGLEP